MSWQDVVDQIPQEEFGPSFPYIQWVNDGGSLDPRAPTGGFAQPEEQMSLVGDWPRGAEMRGLALKSGELLQVAFAPWVRAAVLATRFAWILDGQRVPTYVPGARSKLQVLAVVAGERGPFLTMLTFSGMAGKEFAQAHRTHRRRVLKAAGREVPASIFYATYTALGYKMVGKNGQQSRITGIGLEDASEEIDLDAAFIGEEALALVDWEQVAAWRTAWNGRQAVINGDNGEEWGYEEEPVATAPAQPQAGVAVPAPAVPVAAPILTRAAPVSAPAPASAAPAATPTPAPAAPGATPQQRDEIARLFGVLGARTPDAVDGSLRAQGFAPLAVIPFEEAQQVIARLRQRLNEEIPF